MQQTHPAPVESRRPICIRQIHSGVPTTSCKEGQSGEKMLQITWLIAGHGSFLNQGKPPVEIGAGHLVMTKQSRSHLHHLSPNAEGYSVRFSDSFLEGWQHLALNQTRLLRLCRTPKGIPIPGHLMEEMTTTARNILREQAVPMPFQTILLREYGRILLVQATRTLAINTAPIDNTASVDDMVSPLNSVFLPNTHYGSVTKQFLALVDTAFDQRKPVGEYARALFVTANHLNFIVKTVTGYPASHHIKQRVIQEAKRKLERCHIPMKEIAYSLGFEDPAHFSKYFKASTGATFSAFKKSNE